VWAMVGVVLVLAGMVAVGLWSFVQVNRQEAEALRRRTARKG
jgi:high-affinity Fe2+/Pb2+ permease